MVERAKKPHWVRKGIKQMAYFANGSEGSYFEQECARCRFGEGPCPIAEVQSLYNYDAVNNEVATKVLDMLVSDDGACSMLHRFPVLRKASGAEKEIIPSCDTCRIRRDICPHYCGSDGCKSIYVS
jgi:hypothetical protein